MRYPKNLKEVLIMSIPNALTMVIGMVTINLWIYNSLSVAHFARCFAPIFLAAFCLDFFIAGPLSMRLLARVGNKYMPLVRVAIMAGILTFVAPIIESGHVVSMRQYLTTVPRNYIIALILQVVVAMRIGMAVFNAYLARYDNK